jgi:hypothetical protein
MNVKFFRRLDPGTLRMPCIVVIKGNLMDAHGIQARTISTVTPSSILCFWGAFVFIALAVALRFYLSRREWSSSTLRTRFVALGIGLVFFLIIGLILTFRSLGAGS